MDSPYQVTIEVWPGLALDVEQLHATLLDFAHDIERPVSLRRYDPEEVYGHDVLAVRVFSPDSSQSTSMVPRYMEMEGGLHELTEAQRHSAFLDVLPVAERIEDINGNLVAAIEHDQGDAMIIPFALMAAESDDAWSLLRCILAEAGHRLNPNPPAESDDDDEPEDADDDDDGEDTASSVPPVLIDGWDGMALSRPRLEARLRGLAERVGKQVLFGPYCEDLLYADPDVLHVHVCMNVGRHDLAEITIQGRSYLLEGRQQADLSGGCSLAPEGDYIADEGGHPLAFVQNGHIVFTLELTQVDNEAAWAILDHVLQEALPLLTGSAEDAVPAADGVPSAPAAVPAGQATRGHTVATQEVTVDLWPSARLPEAEISAALQYLAYKTARPVTFRPYADGEGYSQDCVSVRIFVHDGRQALYPLSEVLLGGVAYQLSPEQKAMAAALVQDTWERIQDEQGRIIGFVDRNRLIVPIEITASDNEAARTVLSYVVEKAPDLLDFDLSDVMREKEEEFLSRFSPAFGASIKRRLESRTEELTRRSREAEDAYYTILQFEREKPSLQKEIELLTRLSDNPRSLFARNQSKALMALESGGLYSRISLDPRGNLAATTSRVVIQYDGYEFPVGRYEVQIAHGGEVIIRALDPHPGAEHPHPHVGTDGRPCLGNIGADLARLIGRLRLAEALQLIHTFLSSYNSANPYEKIGRFDPTHEYCDEEADPCEDCDEKCSPYCIHSCESNQGSMYTCDDCYDLRSDYCFKECSYNEDFARFHPCTGCQKTRTPYCYLDCSHNEEWLLQNPCDRCEETCTEKCVYFDKGREFGYVDSPATRISAGQGVSEPAREPAAVAAGTAGDGRESVPAGSR